MSWELMHTASILCPCGRGKITRKDYGDDWNRFEEEYLLDCPICAAKYRIVSKSYYVHAGDYGTYYYLLPRDYPEYSGVKVKDVFPDDVNVHQMPFDQYLVKTYLLADLHDAREEFSKKTSVVNLTGVAADIAKKHKKAFKSARVSFLKDYVISACEIYNKILDNKEHRLPVEQQEADERSAYEQKKREHLIRILL